VGIGNALLDSRLIEHNRPPVGADLPRPRLLAKRLSKKQRACLPVEHVEEPVPIANITTFLGWPPIVRSPSTGTWFASQSWMS